MCGYYLLVDNAPSMDYTCFVVIILSFMRDIYQKKAEKSAKEEDIQI